MNKRLFGMALCMSLIFVTGAAFAQYTDIADLQVYTVAGAPDETATHYGTTVTVRGFVTCPPGRYNSGTHYVQDATGGIGFFLNGTGLALGDEVEVSGTVGAYSGEIQITPDPSVNYIGAGTVPAPLDLTPAQALADYGNVGTLVSVTGIIADTMGSSTFSVYVGTDSVLVYIDSTTLIDISAVAPGDEYEITSPLVNYNGLLELKPRYQSDLVEDPSGDTLPVISDVTCADWVVLADEALTVTATIVDNSGISSAMLYYRDSTGDDDVSAFSSVAMTLDAGDTYTGTTPASWMNSQIDFYIEATDDGAQTVTNPGTAPTTFLSTAIGLTDIYDMQYTHPDSSGDNNYMGLCVSVQGVVTAGTGEAGSPSKFIMQQTDGPEGGRFCGLLIYESSGANTVFQGDLVEVAGRGNEYYGLGQILPHNPDAIRIVSWGHDLPEAELVGAGVLSDDIYADDPEEGDGTGYLGEAYESVWVRSYQSAVTFISGFGDYAISEIVGDTVAVDPMVTLSYVPVLDDNVIVYGFMDYDYGTFEITPIADANVIVNPVAVPNLDPSRASARIDEISPNPFNPKTEIKFTTKLSDMVSLNLYDVRGNLVKVLVSGHMPANSYSIPWDGKSDAGRQMPSGTYFARLRVGTKHVEVQKMQLVK